MPRLLTIFIVIIILLSACASALADMTNVTPSRIAPIVPYETATQTAIPQSTSTLTPAPSETETPIPSETMVMSFQDIQELTRTNQPTSDPNVTRTPYPTFDAKNAKTHTPFKPALCPVEDPNYKISPDIFKKGDSINNGAIAWNEINKGASFDQVIKALKQVEPQDYKYTLEKIDLTGDGVPELIIRLISMVVIGCDQGRYKTILLYGDGFSAPSIVSVQDMNLNGIPDVVLAYYATTGGNLVVDILEWDGTQFNSLIQGDHGENAASTSRLARALYWYEYFGQTPMMNGPADIAIKDTDNDGTKELILTDKGPIHEDTLNSFGPWRGKQVVFKWDGIHYLYSSLEMNPPSYRFQAVQDADRLFLMGENDRALKLYQDVIFSDKLDWLSEYKKMRFVIAAVNQFAPPHLPQDPTEYKVLSSYARYRIVLLHLTRGWANDAGTVYKTLLQMTPKESIGYPFVEMATILWNEYQRSKDLKQACQLVVNYVKNNSDLLNSLNENWYGNQSHQYTPEDFCPF